MPPSVLDAAEQLATQLQALVEQARTKKELDLPDLRSRLRRVVDFAERLGLDDRRRVARNEVRWRYKTLLPAVRDWKEWVVNADLKINEFLATHNRARDFAEDVGFKWTKAVCNDLAARKPSNWLIDMLAKRYGRSRATISDRVHRRINLHA